MEAALKPGIYDGVSRAVYESWPAINFSTLKHFRKTAAHAKYRIAVPTEPTEAMEMGSAVHTAILEPERFAVEYVASPQCDRRTTEGKEAWRSFEEANRGKEILHHNDYGVCAAMRDSVWRTESVAREILSAPGGKNERSFVWLDRLTGQLCKGRCDRMCRWNGWTIVGDLKTSKSAEKDEFARDIGRYSYHVQAALYLDGLDALASVHRRYIWVALEKEQPYLFAAYEPTDRLIEQGRRTYRDWLNQYDTAVTKDIWPGYLNNIEPIDLPRWAQDEGSILAEAS